MDGIQYSIDVQVSKGLQALERMEQKLGALGRAAADQTKSLNGLSAGSQGLMGKLGALGLATQGVAVLLKPLSLVADAASAAFSKLSEQMIQSVRSAASMESTKTAFTTLTGGAEKAGKVLGELQALGAETPFEFPELADAGRKLIAFGESSATVAETLRRVGDVSSGIQAPIGEIAEIYGKARVQGNLFAEDINQLQGRGIPILSQLAEITGKSVGEVRNLASEGKVSFPLLDQAFRNLTSSGGMFFDQMKAQSETFNGKISNMADAWGQLQVKFATPIIDALKPLLDSANGEIGRMGAMAKQVGEEIAKWATYMTGAFTAGKGFEAVGVDFKIAMMTATNDFVTWFQGKFQGMASGFAGAVADAIDVSGSTGAAIRQAASEETANKQATGGSFGGELSEALAQRKQLAAISEQQIRLDEVAARKKKEYYDWLNGVGKVQPKAKAVGLDQAVKDLNAPKGADSGASSSASGGGAGGATSGGPTPLQKMVAATWEKMKAGAAESVKLQKELMAQAMRLQGNEAGANAIERELTLRAEVAQVMAKTNLSHEKALELVKLKFNLEDRAAAKKQQEDLGKSAAEAQANAPAAKRGYVHRMTPAEMAAHATKQQQRAGSQVSGLAEFYQRQSQSLAGRRLKDNFQFKGLDKFVGAQVPANPSKAKSQTQEAQLLQGILDFFEKRVAAI